jgi:hypothetical protein
MHLSLGMVARFKTIVVTLVLCTSVWALTGCPRHHEQAQLQPLPKLPEMTPAPVTPIAEKREALRQWTWDRDWNGIVEHALPPELLSPQVARDVRPFCPRFNRMDEQDRRDFWAYFFQALAGAEAGLFPTTNVRHTEPEVAVKDTVTKRMVRSEGLLQLTYMDADRYGCDFDWEKDKHLPEKDPAKTILQPKNNLTCGVRILDNQLITQRKPLLSRTSYWSTLQPGTVSYRVFAKQMANVPSVCRVAPVADSTKLTTASAAPPSSTGAKSVQMAKSAPVQNNP